MANTIESTDDEPHTVAMETLDILRDMKLTDDEKWSVLCYMCGRATDGMKDALSLIEGRRTRDTAGIVGE